MGTKLSHHNFEISRNNVSHLVKVDSNVRKKLSRPQGDGMRYLENSTIEWYTITWLRTALLHDRAVLHSDSVLCLGKIHEYPQTVEAWKQKTEWFTNSYENRD